MRKAGGGCGGVMRMGGRGVKVGTGGEWRREEIQGEKGRCPCRNDEKDNRASQKGNVACCRPL